MDENAPRESVSVNVSTALTMSFLTAIFSIICVITIGVVVSDLVKNRHAEIMQRMAAEQRACGDQATH